MDRIEKLTDEVRQLKSQYVDEVGTGRKVWPKSIKERVFELHECGVPLRTVAKSTTVPYQTILSWRHQVRHKNKFHALTVQQNALPKIGSDSTVTVESDPILESRSHAATIIVTLPNGMRIESSEAKIVVEILRALKIGGH